MPCWVGTTLILLALGTAAAQPPLSSGPERGTLLIDGGGATPVVVKEFVRLAGGPDARIVVIPTGASSLRFGPKLVILDPDWPRDRKEWHEYDAHLKDWFGVSRVTILHTRDRAIADSDAFVEPLRHATGVFLSAGNAGRHAAAYRATRTQKELEGVLHRGGVILGSSAGAIVQGSFMVRGRPDKPLLMAKGSTEGFGFLRNVAINPHLSSAKRDNELVNVCDEYPHILGIGIDDDAALLVRRNEFNVVGSGRAAIYDNQRHESGWYYWLNPGDRFDLASWRKTNP